MLTNKKTCMSPIVVYRFYNIALFHSKTRRHNTSPIEPTVSYCDISDNNSLLKCVIADVTRE